LQSILFFYAFLLLTILYVHVTTASDKPVVIGISVTSGQAPTICLKKHSDNLHWVAGFINHSTAMPNGSGMIWSMGQDVVS
jgi:hypothetical protein